MEESSTVADIKRPARAGTTSQLPSLPHHTFPSFLRNLYYQTAYEKQRVCMIER